MDYDARAAPEYAAQMASKLRRHGNRLLRASMQQQASSIFSNAAKFESIASRLFDEGFSRSSITIIENIIYETGIPASTETLTSAIPETTTSSLHSFFDGLGTPSAETLTLIRQPLVRTLWVLAGLFFFVFLPALVIEHIWREYREHADNFNNYEDAEYVFPGWAEEELREARGEVIDEEDDGEYDGEDDEEDDGEDDEEDDEEDEEESEESSEEDESEEGSERRPYFVVLLALQIFYIFPVYLLSLVWAAVVWATIPVAYLLSLAWAAIVWIAMPTIEWALDDLRPRERYDEAVRRSHAVRDRFDALVDNDTTWRWYYWRQEAWISLRRWIPRALLIAYSTVVVGALIKANLKVNGWDADVEIPHHWSEFKAFLHDPLRNFREQTVDWEDVPIYSPVHRRKTIIISELDGMGKVTRSVSFVTELSPSPDAFVSQTFVDLFSTTTTPTPRQAIPDTPSSTVTETQMPSDITPATTTPSSSSTLVAESEHFAQKMSSFTAHFRQRVETLRSVTQTLKAFRSWLHEQATRTATTTPTVTPLASSFLKTETNTEAGHFAQKKSSMSVHFRQRLDGVRSLTQTLKAFRSWVRGQATGTTTTTTTTTVSRASVITTPTDQQPVPDEPSPEAAEPKRLIEITPTRTTTTVSSASDTEIVRPPLSTAPYYRNYVQQRLEAFQSWVFPAPTTREYDVYRSFIRAYIASEKAKSLVTALTDLDIDLEDFERKWAVVKSSWRSMQATPTPTNPTVDWQ